MTQIEQFLLHVKKVNIDMPRNFKVRYILIRKWYKKLKALLSQILTLTYIPVKPF